MQVFVMIAFTSAILYMGMEYYILYFNFMYTSLKLFSQPKSSQKKTIYTGII